MTFDILTIQDVIIPGSPDPSIFVLQRRASFGLVLDTTATPNDERMVDRLKADPATPPPPEAIHDKNIRAQPPADLDTPPKCLAALTSLNIADLDWNALHDGSDDSDDDWLRLYGK